MDGKNIVTNPKADSVGKKVKGHKHNRPKTDINNDNTETKTNNPSSQEKAIAIIGMAFRVPGANNAQEFWGSMVQGKNSVTEVPQDRWIWQDYFGDPQKEVNKTNSKWGGFIEDIDKFDPLFFNISPKEANYIDPQHRIFLETVWHAIENAGYSPKSLAGKKIGIYAGVSKNDYAELLGDNISAFVSTGTVHSILANRVSYLLDFHGPSQAIDTACSSSLVALHNAVRDIRDGDCEAAIVGGVNALLSPRMYISHAKSGMLSQDGQCKTFDESANGYVRGEGVAALFLKPLEQALADRDNVIGIIRSTAVNHGGRANFLTAPNLASQADVIYTALKKGDVDPRNISYIETHGTGTSLGDPIEINALKKAYGKYFEDKNIEQKDNYCGLSAVKTNIGHLESAAGVASIVKVLLAMRYGMIPPVCNFKKLNPYIKLEDSPFFIVNSLTRWEKQRIDNQMLPRQAAVSSFGMGGVNAHVILEEPPEIEKQRNNNSNDRLILLSAKKGRLKETVSQLVEYLNSESGKNANIDDIAFTLMFGRDEYEERLALITSSTIKMSQNLQSYLNGQIPEQCFLGLASGKKDETVYTAGAQDDKEKLAAKWVNGDRIAWDITTFDGYRIELPGYPFLRQRCWFVEKYETAANPIAKRPDSNTVYKADVSNSEPMVSDHVVQKTKVLPGVGYIELTRQMLEKETTTGAGKKWSFKNIYWLTPLDFSDTPKEIALSVKSGETGLSFVISTLSAAHCQGDYAANQEQVSQGEIDIQAVVNRCTNEQAKDGLYAVFSENGLDYGPSFQVIDKLYWSRNEAIAKIDTNNISAVNAGLLDGALQTAVCLSVKNNTASDTQYVPYFADIFNYPEDLKSVSYYYVKQYENNPGASIRFDVYYCDDKGRVLGSIKNFTKRALKNNGQDNQPIYYYTAQWKQQECVPEAAEMTGFLMVNGDENLEGSILPKINNKIPVVKMQLTDTFNWHSEDRVTIDGSKPDDYLNVFIKLKERGMSISHIVVQSPNSGHDGLSTLLVLVQSLIKAKFKNSIKIICLEVNSSKSDLSYVYSAGGLARTLKFEYPRICLQVLHMDKTIEEYAGTFMDELLSQTVPLNEIKYEDGQRFVRVMETLPDKPVEQGTVLKKDRVYIISGGTGGLGHIFCEYLAKNCKAKLVLLGRQPVNQKIRDLLDKIKTLGGSGDYIATDIGDESQLRQAIQSVRDSYGHIDGVIQASGLIEDSFILNKKLESFDRVIRPKIQGTLNLDKVTADDKLDFFIMFSSIAALMPNQGQCDYASGNSFMDYYAEFRRNLVSENKRSGVSLAINWPLWANGGMQVKPEEKEHLETVFGMKPLATHKGLKLFNDALNFAAGQNLTQVVGIEGDKKKIDAHFNIKKTAGLDMESVGLDLIRKDLKSIVALALRIPLDNLDISMPFREIGVDSVLLLRLVHMVNLHLDVDLQPTVLFEYDTLHQIFEYLINEKLAVIKKNYAKFGALAPMYRSTGLVDIGSCDMDKHLFQRTYDNKEFYMVDHVVDEKFNVPGACYIEMARQAACFDRPDKKVARLSENYWARQLSSSGDPFNVYIQFTEKGDKSYYEIYSLEETQEKIIHATGSIVYEEPGIENHNDQTLDIKAIRQRCTTRRSREEVYKQIHAEGLMVGPSFMPMEEIVLNENEALAVLELPQIIEDTYEDYLLHPTMLTGVFQTALINNRFHGDDNRDFIPIAIESLVIDKLIPKKCYVYSALNSKSKNNQEIKKFNIAIADENGHVLMKLDNFAIKARNIEKSNILQQRLPQTVEAYVEGRDTLRPQVQKYLKTLLSQNIGMDSADIKADEPFESYGINSVLILELNKVLEEAFGSGLSKTLFFEYRNLSELTDYFMEEHKEQLIRMFGASKEKEEDTVFLPAEQVKISTEVHIANPTVQKQFDQQPGVRDVAIIGLAGRYPKADNLDEFWNILKTGNDCIEEIPKDRFDYLPYYDPDKHNNKLYSKWGSFISDVDKFDPMFFNISPREAELMDPQERLFMEVVWHAMEDAGYTRQSLGGQPVGVFVGALWQPYLELGAAALNNGSMVRPSTLLYSIANRVSYFCNFRGPSLTVDTACSSSLTALHLACRSIIEGESSLAIAGGVNLSIGAGKYLFLSQYKFLSSDGRCRSFGEGGDGYVPGEGIGAVLLKPLEKAEQDGDHIYGVIKATSINHGGKTNGYTVPNPLAQSEAIQRALQQSGINPRTISYMEAHGTGTALGDPIEINALTKVFSKYTKEKQYCPIGSLKSNIGHLEASAGIAGLTKILLQIKHGQIAPSLHSKVLNPNIDFLNTPFTVPQELIEWKRPVVEIDGETREYPRIAGVSSFGAGGSNAHAVIEEYIPQKYVQPIIRISTQNPAIIILSARNKERLKLLAKQLLTAVREKTYLDTDLADIAYTLQMGREAFDERLALIVSSINELEEKLYLFIEGKDNTEGIYQGQVKHNKETGIEDDEDLHEVIETWVKKGKFNKLLELWVKGLNFDWNKLYGNSRPCRISLPVYPFAKERYWLPDIDATPDAVKSSVGAVIHPLLHHNTSDLFGQRFSTMFTGSEFFLKEHTLRDECILPGVAYLEMARAAVEKSLGMMKTGHNSVVLKNVVWIQPIIVGSAGREIHIGLTAQDEREISYQVYSNAAGNDGEPVIHNQGYALLKPVEKTPELDLQGLRAQCNLSTISASKFYETMRAMGYQHGSAFQGVEELFVGNNQVLIRMSLPASVSGTSKQFVLHPSIIDSPVQASIGMVIEFGAVASPDGHISPVLPFALEQLEIFGDCTEKMWALVQCRENNSAADKVRKFDIDLCDENGRVCIRIKGLSSRVMEGLDSTVGHSAKKGTMLLSPSWTEKAAKKETAAPEYHSHFVILCEQNKVLKEHIEDHIEGACCIVLQSQKDGVDERYEAYAQEVFDVVLNIFKSKPAGKVLVQIMTQSQGEEMVFSGLLGLLKTARLENPKLFGQMIEVEGKEDIDIIIEMLLENSLCPEDSHIRYVDGKRRIAGWNEIKDLGEEQSIPWKDRGIYLITGGAGGLGLIFAREISNMVKEPTLILTGRSGLDDAKQEKFRELEASGARVIYKQVDVSDRNAVDDLIGSIRDGFGNVNGIIHSAGIIKDNYIHKKTRDELVEVLAPKVSGLVNLDRASKDMKLDFFVFFSSIAGELGNVGQADYSTANAFMDAYAGYRSALAASSRRTGNTLSINWPLWKDGGMQVDSEVEKMMLENAGMSSIETSTGIRVFYQAMASGQNRVMVAEGKQKQLKQKLLCATDGISGKSKIAATVPKITAEINSEKIQENLKAALLQIIARLLKINPNNIDINAELSIYGFDSVTFMEFSNSLNREYKLKITPAIFFEYSTVQSLVEYLSQEYGEIFSVQEETRVAENVIEHVLEESPGINRRILPVQRIAMQPVQGPSTTSSEAIAIVGMSGVFPMAENLDEFWRNLVEGRDCISEVPKDRWDWREYFGDPNKEANKTNIKWGGFIDNVDKFDPQFFGISPAEAEFMDPQQRLLMMYVWKAIEDAGYSAQSLSGTKTAIFVGTMDSGYSGLIDKENIAIEEYSSTGTVPSVGPNRMSYFLNIHGPSEPVETACSSSLVAIHRAVGAIESGTCDMAIVGGVNTMVTPMMHISFNKAGMLCEDGRCKTFSNKANGYVRGEGAGMLFLKRLKDAELAGDHIYAVIRATAENHGGRANSLTAPNPKAQSALLRTAYTKADIDPRTVTYIETHGTGTALGDPIEINGLKTAFKELYQATGDLQNVGSHCGLGAVKTNIGHLELASGIAGVIKVLLQLKYKTLVKSLHCTNINPYIQLEGSPFYIVQENREWMALKDAQGRDIPRRAGVSSFGFGGVNAHVVIEEYIPKNPLPAQITVTPHNPAIVVLSAKDENRLKEKAQQLLNAIVEHEMSDDSLADIAYTLQLGRDVMEERLAMIVSTMNELKDNLKSFLEGQPGIIKGVYKGNIKQSKEALAVLTTDEDMAKTIDVWISKSKYEKLMDLWVKGLTIDWDKFYGHKKPRRISLPTYPFARERYWVPKADGSVKSGTVREAYIHPLLHQNTSDFSEQRFSSTFTGNEIFLADHVVDDQKVIPAVAYMEMAREAVRVALGACASKDLEDGKSVIIIKNMVWIKPVIVKEQPVKVHTGLFLEDNGAIGFEIYSRSNDTEESVIHSQGSAMVTASYKTDALDLKSLQDVNSKLSLSPSQCYETFKAMGIDYGAAYQCIEKVYVGQDHMLAKLHLNDKVSRFVLHPGIMDSALQVVGLMLGRTNSKLSLPFAVDELEILGKCTQDMWALSRFRKEDNVHKIDVDLCNDEGEICARIKGLVTDVSLRVIRFKC